MAGSYIYIYMYRGHTVIEGAIQNLEFRAFGVKGSGVWGFWLAIIYCVVGVSG